MTRTSPQQAAFNAGELSPLLYGREDYSRWASGLRSCNGFLPIRQGGVTRAPGTLFMGQTRNDAKARLLTFEFAIDDALVLELTDKRMRVWRYGDLVMDGDAPFELVTPYDSAAIARLQYVQSADVIYLVDGTLPIHRLARFSLTDWTIEPLVLTDGPFRVGNVDPDKTITITPANDAELAEVGETVALTGAGNPFDSTMIGTLLQVEAVSYPEIALFTANTPIKVGDFIRSDGNIYQLVAEALGGTANDDDARTGVVVPSHVEGTQLTDRERGTKYKFISDGRAILRILSVVNGNTATAEVLRTVPPSLVTTPTYRWAESAWSSKYGYPSAIELFDQRLVTAGSPKDPRTVWFSTIGSFTEFAGGGEADEAFAYSIAGSESLNRIIWLKAGTRGLHVGALGNEFSMRSDTAGQAIGPANFDLGVDASIGSHQHAPIAPDGKPIFISKDRRRVYEMRYAFDEDANRPVELSLTAEHLGADLFEEIVWQNGQQRVGWVRMGDGTLSAMLHDPQEEVLGWARYSVAGGFVEAITTYPNPDSGRDLVMLVVRRTIDGETVRHVELQSEVYGLEKLDVRKANHLFSATDFDPAPLTDTYSVPQLSGQQVHAWTEQGAFGPLQVAADGAVTLPVEVDFARIGLLDATHQVETLPVRAAARDGDTTSRNRRLVPSGGARVHRTSGGTITPIERDYERGAFEHEASQILPPRIGSENQELYSGVIELQFGTGFSGEVSYRIRPEGGAPLTLLTLTPMVIWGGG